MVPDSPRRCQRLFLACADPRELRTLSDCLEPNGYPGLMIESTAQARHTGRRVVRRRARPAIDKALAVAFEGLPPDIWPELLAYADAKRAEYAGRQALSTAMTRHGVRWHQVNDTVRELVYG